MRIHWLLCLVAVLCSCFLSAQISDSQITPVPEMARLAQALVGNWKNVETMEVSEEFPKGAQRQGVSHCGLGTGGTTLICQGSSDGSAGKLNHLIVIWWDNHAKDYGFFVCFKDRGSGCETRGVAHWEGNTFVNDYTELLKGKPVKMRDSFVDIAPNSHTLIAAVQTDGGGMKTLITTRSTRR
jgi:hypothetical protein